MFTCREGKEKRGKPRTESKPASEKGRRGSGSAAVSLHVTGRRLYPLFPGMRMCSVSRRTRLEKVCSTGIRFIHFSGGPEVPLYQISGGNAPGSLGG